MSAARWKFVLSLVFVVLRSVAPGRAQDTDPPTLSATWSTCLGSLPYGAIVAARAVVESPVPFPQPTEALAMLWHEDPTLVSDSVRTLSIYSVAVGPHGTLPGQLHLNTTVDESSDFTTDTTPHQSLLTWIVKGKDDRLCWGVVGTPAYGCYMPFGENGRHRMMRGNVSADIGDVVAVHGTSWFVMALGGSASTATLEEYGSLALAFVNPTAQNGSGQGPSVVPIPNSSVSGGGVYSLTELSTIKFACAPDNEGSPVCAALIPPPGEAVMVFGLTPTVDLATVVFAKAPLLVRGETLAGLTLPNGTGVLLISSPSAMILVHPATGKPLAHVPTQESVLEAVCGGRWAIRGRSSVSSPAVIVVDLLQQTPSWPSFGPDVYYFEHLVSVCDVGVADEPMLIAVWTNAPNINVLYIVAVETPGSYREVELAAGEVLCGSGRGMVFLCTDASIRGLDTATVQTTVVFTLSVTGGESVPAVVHVLPASNTALVMQGTAIAGYDLPSVYRTTVAAATTPVPPPGTGSSVPPRVATTSQPSPSQLVASPDSWFATSKGEAVVASSAIGLMLGALVSAAVAYRVMRKNGWCNYRRRQPGGLNTAFSVGGSAEPIDPASPPPQHRECASTTVNDNGNL